MASKEEILKEIDFLSDRLSAQVRTVAISVIAVAWLFLVGGKDAPILSVPPSHTLILLAGGLSLSALVADYFQYLMGYWTSKNVLKAGEGKGGTDYRYDYTATTYKLRSLFFWLKQILVIGGFSVLAYSIGMALSH